MNIQEYIHLLDVKEVRGDEVASLEFPMVKVSLNIGDHIDRSIRYISSELDVKRSELMRDLLMIALTELEKHFNLDPLDFDEPYANYIFAGVDDFKLGPITVTKQQFIDMVRKSSEKNEGVENE